MWYSVPIYQRSSEAVNGEVVVEESIYLVEAESATEAEAAARTVAAKLPIEYVAGEGNAVSWEVEGFGEPWRLFDKPGNGIEVFSRLMLRRDLEALKRPFSQAGEGQ
jgi:hypothetical protein